MKRFILNIAATVMISATLVGCCTGGRKNCCEEEGTDRAPGLFASREAPRGEVAVALPGVLRSTPASRSRDDSFPVRSRSAVAPISPDDVQDRDVETDRLAAVEKKVTRLTSLLEALNEKVNDKCK